MSSSGLFAGPWWQDEPSDDGAGYQVRLIAGARSWSVAMQRTSVTLLGEGNSEPADAEVSGTPQDMVLWLWWRSGDEVSGTQ